MKTLYLTDAGTKKALFVNADNITYIADIAGDGLALAEIHLNGGAPLVLKVLESINEIMKQNSDINKK